MCKPRIMTCSWSCVMRLVIFRNREKAPPLTDEHRTYHCISTMQGSLWTEAVSSERDLEHIFG